MFKDNKSTLDALLQQFFASPVKTLAKNLSYCISRPSITKPRDAITVVCMSDTHNRFPEVPGGDLLIHAGDLSERGTRHEIQNTLDWIHGLPHEHKVVVAGNHELLLDPQKGFPDAERTLINWHDIIYLQDCSRSLRFQCGRILNLYGSPWTRKHGNWAFEYSREVDNWTDAVPKGTDVLITHMPPFGHLDLNGLGDENLLHELRRVRPCLHVFGHLHASHGKKRIFYDRAEPVFEAVLRGESGIRGILMLGCYVAYSWFAPHDGKHMQSSILVNAAIVGGARDTEVRTPITLEI